jgi:tetratricopeptide (TPR) repeat protein
MSIKLVTVLSCAFSFFGCAAAGVPSTSDPIEKLKLAIELFDHQGRPLPAEKLIEESISICTKKNDQSCLGEAYSTYGFFFRSNSVVANEEIYRKIGFLDKSATFDNRLIKSKEYFEKSIANYTNTAEFDLLTTAYLNLGFTYSYLNDTKNVCEAFKRSLEYNQKYTLANPNTKIVLPPEYATFADYIHTKNKRAGCL